MLGDFFLTGDIDKGLLEKFKGRQLTKESLNEFIPDELEDIIMNLKKEDLIKLLLKE